MVVDFVIDAEKGSESSIAPHASSALSSAMGSPQLVSKSSSVSGGGEVKGLFDEVEVLAVEGLRPELTNGVVVVDGFEFIGGRVVGGILLDRGSGDATRDVPFEVAPDACICPFAVVGLFVKDEMAQPVQVRPSLGTGVPIRGVAPVLAPAAVAGCTVSGRVSAYLRMRVR